MAQIEHGMHKILSSPWVYDLYQRIVGAKRARQRVVEEIIKPISGQTILDVGCGTASILDLFPVVNYYGVDLSPQYIEKARQRFADRGQFQVAAADEMTFPADIRFDTVFALGVLHHLNDEQVDNLFKMVLRILSPRGRFVSVDPTLVDDQHPFARFLIKRDRGLNVRTQTSLLDLAGKHFSSTDAQTRSDLLRIPYTHVVLECVLET